MYGLIGKIRAAPGMREALISLLIEASGANSAAVSQPAVEILPGCLSYVVARDAEEAEAIWVTEVWEDAESHQASLRLEQVQKAIEKARPLIAGFGERFETIPVGGFGLIKSGGAGE